MENNEIEILNINLEPDEDIEVVECLDLYQFVSVDKGQIEINIPGLNKIKLSIPQMRNLDSAYIDSLNLDEEKSIDLKYIINEVQDIVSEKINLYSYFGFKI